MTMRKELLLYGTCFLLIAAMAVLLWIAPPDGLERGDLPQFFGRFHPLIVHLPVGLLLLTLVLESARFFRSGAHLHAASGFVLGLATASALFSVSLGWLLAWSGGYEGRLVTLHMWGGFSLAAVLLLCSALRGWNPKVYGLALVAALGLLGWTSDQGGKLTHGESFLTEHMPAKLRAILHVSPLKIPPKKTLPVVAPEAFAPASGVTMPAKFSTTFFESRVAPIFSERCVTCHGPEKKKGRLRLDSFDQVMRGGKHGPVIKSGDPNNSEMIRRVSLPRDDEHAMPAEGKPGLTATDIAVIAAWIASGASRSLPVEAVRGAPPLPVPQPAPSPLIADYRQRLTVIELLQNRFGIRLVPRSDNPRDGLILRTVTAPSRCDDAVLEALSPIADLIVDAELARTKITNAGVKHLATFSNLRALDLSHTAITSSGLTPLSNLTNLESLNLTATDVDDQGVLPLRRKPGLRHLYLFETKCLDQPSTADIGGQN